MKAWTATVAGRHEDKKTQAKPKSQYLLCNDKSGGTNHEKIKNKDELILASSKYCIMTSGSSPEKQKLL